MTPTLARFAGLLAAGWFAAAGAAAQTNGPAAPVSVPSPTNRPSMELRESVRADCLAGRRSICGRILRILPEGLLVESGYTNLARGPFTKSWLVPGAVVANRPEHALESREPGALCVGTVLLTDPPRGKPRPFDYVVLAGYPTGETTYTSVGSVRKTVRRFSANLDKAVLKILAPAGAGARPPG